MFSIPLVPVLVFCVSVIIVPTLWVMLGALTHKPKGKARTFVTIRTPSGLMRVEKDSALYHIQHYG